MSLKYTCPGCGTPLGYEGLCWKCKCERERNAALAWTPEQIAEKQKNLIQNIQRLADMEDPELTDFWQLLSYRDAITPEIQRAALDAEVYRTDMNGTVRVITDGHDLVIDTEQES